MAINKVIRKGAVVLDLTSDTVTPETLMSGATAHNAAGDPIVGTASSGIDTSDATATSNDILANKTAYVDGEKIIGNIPSKSSSDLTSSGATVTVPAGHYASQATKTIASGSAKTPATIITKNPTISVNSSGLITASVSGTQSVTPTVTSGYVSSGTEGTITVSGSATKQLTVQAAQTITPGTSNKTIASGRYLTGTQTIKGDANLVAGNIKSGVSIFGVTGTHSGGEDLEAIISEQEALIQELSTTLDSKASGSSGGGSVETCTVNFLNQANLYGVEYYYTSLDESGKVISVCVTNTSGGNVTCTKVLCGSFMCCNCISYQTYNVSCENSELFESGASSMTSFFRITAAQGETATITLTGSGNSGYENY